MSFRRSLAIRYGLAVGSVALLVLLKWRFIPHLGPEAPFLMGVVPALIVTWYGGPGPGALAAVLSTAAIPTLFVSPEELRGGDGALEAVLKVMLFAGENAVVVALMVLFQSSRTRTEQALARIRSSYELSAACGRAQDAHQAADAVLRPLLATLGANAAAVFLAAPEERKLRLFAYRVPPRQTKLIALYAETLVESPTAMGVVARTRKAMFVENRAQWRAMMPEFFAELRKQHAEPAALLCIPMIVRETLVGVLAAGFPEERRFSAEDRSWTQALADDFGRALDRVRLLETERRAVSDAAQANRAKDDFLALVSEELRLPVSSIAAWTREARRRPGEHSLAAEAGRTIERSMHFQGRLIDGLLEQSRAVARELRIDAKRIDLMPLLRSSVGPLRIDAAAMGVDLELVPGVEAQVVGDACRLQRAMRDFVSMALDSTPRGGTVRVEIAVHERRVRVRIASDPRGGAKAGSGPNGTSAGSHAPAGTPDASTWLLIARDLLRCHGGDVHVDPTDGPPKTVTIDLPLVDPMAGVIAMTSPAGPTDGAAPSPLLGVRVFLVSDDTVERESIVEIASNHGAEVRSAVSTSDAIDQLRVYSPDIIVTDIVESERSVLKFIRQLRALPTAAAAAPALAYTAASASAQVRAIVEAGYQRYLPRPPEPHALAQAMVELRAPMSRGQSPQS
jgi:signal transduction histidine kinase/CheY-like chemotaxis protein